MESEYAATTSDFPSRSVSPEATEMTSPRIFRLLLTLPERDGIFFFAPSPPICPSPKKRSLSFADASMAYSGSGTFTQTSWVDLEAKELLRTESSGDFDMTVAFAGVPGFDGTMAFTGTFTQELDRR